MRLSWTVWLLVILAALLANAVVAAAGVLFSPADAWRMTHPDQWNGGTSNGADAALVAQFGEVIDTANEVEHRSGLLWEQRLIPIDYSEDQFFRNLDEARSVAAIQVMWPSVMRVASGWPMRSVEGYLCSHTRTVAHRDSKPMGESRSAIVVTPDQLSRLKVPKLFPYAPRWCGLIVNVTVYAAFAWLVVTGLVAMRRAHRVVRARCARCNYPVHNLASDRCPECGEAIPSSVSFVTRVLSVPLLWCVAVVSTVVLALSSSPALYEVYELAVNSHAPWWRWIVGPLPLAGGAGLLALLIWRRRLFETRSFVRGIVALGSIAALVTYAWIG